MATTTEIYGDSELSNTTIVVNRICRQCISETKIEMTADQFVRWQDGGLIQEVCPDMSADDRELLISAICPDCWKELFYG